MYVPSSIHGLNCVTQLTKDNPRQNHLSEELQKIALIALLAHRGVQQAKAKVLSFDVGRLSIGARTAKECGATCDLMWALTQFVPDLQLQETSVNLHCAAITDPFVLEATKEDGEYDPSHVVVIFESQTNGSYILADPTIAQYPWYLNNFLKYPTNLNRLDDSHYSRDQILEIQKRLEPFLQAELYMGVFCCVAEALETCSTLLGEATWKVDNPTADIVPKYLQYLTLQYYAEIIYAEYREEMRSARGLQMDAYQQHGA